VDIAATLFIRSPNGARLDKDKKILYLSSIFKWCSKHFEKSFGSIVEFVKKPLGEEGRNFVEGHLFEIGIAYQGYSRGLNIAS